ncbi:spore germination protein [Viridibacillus arvi]|uniref:spore germination protein n=1 Tax=Viridibacillus arvi TaxID=263475 RepID=UPI0036C000F0
MQQIETFISQLQKTFYNSADFVAREIDWPGEPFAVICYYSSLLNKKDVQEQLDVVKFQAEQEEAKWPDSVSSTIEVFDMEKAVGYVCGGETLIILLSKNKVVRINLPEIAHRTPDEPVNEHIIRGSHEGLVENFDTNMALIRKRLHIPELVVKQMKIGKETNTGIYYLYISNVVKKETLIEVEKRLNEIDAKDLYSVGLLGDYLEDSIYSPFPQLLNTERPDRVVSNLVEGKVVVLSDISPTALIAPVTFFSFYQSPDDYNSRVLVGSFYRIVRLMSFFTAVFLPAFYIAIISFHFEILPLELSKKVKMDVSEIPYRPLIEALILEIIIELIREASIRLPQSVVQTIGIVGGLVVGEVIVNAGLVSNMMVIIVALTAISSFVVPSNELNTSVRILRFPFMFAASLFGFFGITIGVLILFIHLLNLKSINQPYFSPVVPFQPSEFKKIFFRTPFYKAKAQPTSFQPKGYEEKQ